MPKRRKILICLGCVLFTAAIVFISCRRNAEPTYNGLTLSQWMEKLQVQGIRMEISEPDSTDPSVVAIRHIGTNAIPFLLAGICYEPPTIMKLLNKAPTQLLLRFDVRIAQKAMNKSLRAVEGFRILGINAACAIPELSRMLNKNNPGRCRMRAIAAMPHLGINAFPLILQAVEDPDHTLRYASVLEIRNMKYLGTNISAAIPALIRRLSDTSVPVANQAANTLGILKLEPQILIPALANHLASTNAYEVRMAALWALGEFGAKAKPAIQAVSQVLDDPDPHVRATATNVLLKIAPEQLTNIVHQ